MGASVNSSSFKGYDAVELKSGSYTAVIVPAWGSNCVRFFDTERDIEVFRYSEAATAEDIMGSPEIWGLPTLYLPNRFDGGVLRTSDAVYHLPVNETAFGNHIHGFVHKRPHRVTRCEAKGDTAYLGTTFEFDEKDEFFEFLPLDFVLNIDYELSPAGLSHRVTLTNRSSKRLPVSFATHTTVNAPFVKGGRQEDVRLRVPAKEYISFDKTRWLPDGTVRELSDYDREYLTGKCPVLTDICNDMYTGGELDGFRGVIVSDTASGRQILNEVDGHYKFWIIWNHEGFMGYFCPEPMTAQVNAPNMDVPADVSGYEELSPGESYTAVQRFFTRG